VKAIQLERPGCFRRVETPEQLEVLGIMIDGGLTERLVVPARKLHRSTSLASEQCALVETLAIGCHAVNRANVQPDDHVLVIGSGPIGLAVIEFVKLARARTIVMDVNPARLEFVREKIGIPETILARGHREDLAALSALTDRALPDVVIDATGNDQSMSRAVEFVAFGGRLIFVGITPNPLMLDDAILHRRELTVLASRNALPEDFSRIVKLIEMGRLDTRPWITHRASFDDMIETFPIWLRPGSGVVKAVVEL
jgi:2-desacetyl-2-hydroxyethyl bacteriochlorophyllide A dehydrogenase